MSGWKRSCVCYFRMQVYLIHHPGADGVILREEKIVWVFYFHFEVIISSCADVRNNTEISHVHFTQFPLMVTFCITTVQYDSQEINMIESIDLIQISPVSHALICVYGLILCIF